MITCGMSDGGVISAVIPFSTTPYLTLYGTDVIEEEFEYDVVVKEFTTEILVVEFDIDIIEIRECSWPPV